MLSTLSACARDMFPDRQIYVRENGEVKYYVLSGKRQMTIAGASAGAMLGWTALTTSMMFWPSMSDGTMTLETTPLVDADHMARFDGSTRTSVAGNVAAEDAERMAADLTAAQERNRKLESMVAAFRSKIAALEGELEQNRVATSQMNDLLAQESGKSQALDERLVQLAEEREALQAEITGIETGEVAAPDADRVAQLSARLAEVQRLLFEKASLAEEYKTQFAHAMEQRDLARQRAEQLEHEKTKAVEQTASLSARFESKALESQQLAEELSKAEQREEILVTKLESVEDTTETLEEELQRVRAEASEYRERAVDLESQLAAVTAQLGRARDAEARLANAEVTPDTDAARAEKVESVNELRGRIESLEQIQQHLISQLEKTANLDLEAVEGIITNAGLDVDELMDALEPVDTSGVGGPLLDLTDMRKIREVNRPGEHFNPELNQLSVKLNRLIWLKFAMKSLPLSEPLDGARRTSSFGIRKDPFTRKKAFHSGVDFVANLGSEILATAPGKVVYAGPKGAYGRFVEIEHGHGIRTRYAHLASLDVEVGDFVDFQQPIGKIGSTGRSTGVHLHYEVTFGGEFYDPLKFIKAGQDVFKNQTRGG